MEGGECFTRFLANDERFPETQQMLTLGFGEPQLEQQQEVDHPDGGLYNGLQHGVVRWCKHKNESSSGSVYRRAALCCNSNTDSRVSSWLEEKTGIEVASKVRSYKGLMVHVFGRLAAAMALLAFNP